MDNRRSVRVHTELITEIPRVDMKTRRKYLVLGISFLLGSFVYFTTMSVEALFSVVGLGCIAALLDR